MTPQAHSEYDGMILLKPQGKRGSFDATDDEEFEKQKSSLDPALLSPIQDKIEHTNQSQNYNSEWPVEVWEKVMMILERNQELSWKWT